MDSRKSIVAQGYDRMAQRYLEWIRAIEGDPRDRMVALFAVRMVDGGRVLELGCGAGTPSTQQLARRFRVTGVDISGAQLAKAKRNVPGAEFIQADLSEFRTPDESFDGIVALYAVSHVPREEHAELLLQVSRWLVPGGLFLATFGAKDSPDWTGTWLEVPMFFSSYDANTNRDLLRAAGLQLLVDEIVAMREPDGDSTFLWVLAQKPVT